jgi:hypothetical protein
MKKNVKGTSETRRCTAQSKRAGRRCLKAAILGGTVCTTHGGLAPQVRRKAAERLQDLIDPDRLLREAAKLAFSDISQLLGEQGALLPVSQWPKELRGAVAGVKLTKKNPTSGDGVQEDVIEIKLWDKPKAVELLAKHLGLLTERVQIALDGEFVRRLQAARTRIEDVTETAM